MMQKKAKKRSAALFLLLLFAAFFLSSCMRSQSKGVISEQFIAPTLIATIFKTPTIDPFQPTLDPRGPCTDNLTFLDDLSVPDGTVVEPGEEVVKQWQVQNSGSCEWTARYSLRNISGGSYGAEARQKLPVIPPGETGVIEITFTAPDIAGGHFSGWQAYDARGKPFGHVSMWSLSSVKNIEQEFI